MANMGWNSAMDTTATRQMLVDRDTATGEYKIPHIIYADAYSSETVAFADLVLPDTTYLERYDCISLLDRPISDADGAADAIRQPVVPLDADESGRDVRPFQDVLLELGARLGLPGLVDDAGTAKYPRGYAQYIVEHERTPGVGLLAGWRGADGASDGIGAPNPDQLARYVEHGCHWHREVPAAGRFYKMANRDYLEWAKSLGFVGSTAPVTLQFYAETLQRFRLAAQGHGTRQPPERDRARVERFFDPLPFWYASLGDDAADAYPLSAITQRPMFMYHSWGSQYRWLRQIATRNALYLHPDTARGSSASSIRCRSGMRRSPKTMRTTRIRSTRSRSARCSCTTRGARRTAGCARSHRRTRSTSIPIPRAERTSPTATGSGSRRRAGASACRRARTRRPRPAPSGRGTRSASARAPGSSRRTRRSSSTDSF
jgi:anaerobic selenocysteine-containing dehydrogenase